MKFSDVEKITSEGDYEISIGLKHLEETLQGYRDDYSLEVNPDFQRGHVWSKEQQTGYVEFFIRGGVTARTIYFNCPNFNSLTPGKMVCVDGLQRLTALRKFLNNDLKVFGHYLNYFEDKDIFLRKSFKLKFNINNLKTKKEVLKWYLDLNTGGVVHSDQEITRVKDMLNKIN